MPLGTPAGSQARARANRLISAAGCLIAAWLLAGCAPLIHVQNNTRIGVRAWVAQGPQRQPPRVLSVLATRPGQGESVIAIGGYYAVWVSPDTAWVAYAKALREELANRPKDLTSAQLRDITQRLATMMDQFKRATAASGPRGGAGCDGRVGNTEDDVYVRISAGPDDSLLPTCESTKAKPKTSPQ